MAFPSAKTKVKSFQICIVIELDIERVNENSLIGFKFNEHFQVSISIGIYRKLPITSQDKYLTTSLFQFSPYNLHIDIDMMCAIFYPDNITKAVSSIETWRENFSYHR